MQTNCSYIGKVHQFLSKGSLAEHTQAAQRRRLARDNVLPSVREGAWGGATRSVAILEPITRCIDRLFGNLQLPQGTSTYGLLGTPLIALARGNSSLLRAATSALAETSTVAALLTYSLARPLLLCLKAPYVGAILIGTYVGVKVSSGIFPAGKDLEKLATGEPTSAITSLPLHGLLGAPLGLLVGVAVYALASVGLVVKAGAAAVGAMLGASFAIGKHALKADGLGGPRGASPAWAAYLEASDTPRRAVDVHSLWRDTILLREPPLLGQRCLPVAKLDIQERTYAKQLKQFLEKNSPKKKVFQISLTAEVETHGELKNSFVALRRDPNALAKNFSGAPEQILASAKILNLAYGKPDKATRRERAGLVSNMLLSGPPGCGKTTLVRSFAAATDLPLFAMQADHFLNKFYGESSKSIARIFSSLREFSRHVGKRSILFFDEAEVAMPKRSGSGGAWGCADDSLCGSLLQAMDGVTPNDPFTPLVICATNLPEKLDPAATSRLGLHISMSDLCAPQLAGIWAIEMKNVAHTLSETCLTTLGLRASAQGLNGRQIREIIKLTQVRSIAAQDLDDNEELAPLSMIDLEQTLQTFVQTQAAPPPILNPREALLQYMKGLPKPQPALAQ